MNGLKKRHSRIYSNAKNRCVEPRSSKLCQTQNKALGVNRSFIFKVCSTGGGGVKKDQDISFSLANAKVGLNLVKSDDRSESADL